MDGIEPSTVLTTWDHAPASPASPAIEEAGEEDLSSGIHLEDSVAVASECGSDSDSDTCGSDQAHSIGNLSNASLGMMLGLDSLDPVPGEAEKEINKSSTDESYCDDQFEFYEEKDSLKHADTKQQDRPCDDSSHLVGLENVFLTPGTTAGAFTHEQMDGLMQAIELNPTKLSRDPLSSNEFTINSIPECRDTVPAKQKEDTDLLETSLYDRKTHELLQRLFQSNKRLSVKVDQQKKFIQRLQEEKKQAAHLIKSLRCDLELQKQILRNLTNPNHNYLASQLKKTDPLPFVLRPPSRGSSSTTTAILSPRQLLRKRVEIQKTNGDEREASRQVSTAPSQSTSPQLNERSWGRTTPTMVLPRAFSACASSRPPTTRNSPISKPSVCPSGKSNRFGCSLAEGDLSNAESSGSTTQGTKSLQFRLEKLQQERKHLIEKHEQAMADQSRTIARLERDKESLTRTLQEKDHVERLAKVKEFHQARTRIMSCDASHVATTSTSGASPRTMTSMSGQLLLDNFWHDAIPLSGSIDLGDDEIAHTDIGKALQELLDHGKQSFQDKTLHESTQQWLLEIQTSASKLLQLHQQFKLMARLFQQLANCSNSYQLAETITEQVKKLLGAEEAYVFVVDSVEEEFWCRVPRASEGDMITVRSAVMPLVSSSASPACGFASHVYHTRKPLIVPGGKISTHPLHSSSPNNTDRLIKIKSASTLLVPVLPMKTSDTSASTTPLAVVQVVGKIHHVSALGIDICLEKCDSFGFEDQYLLGMVGNFVASLIQKVAYFTDVESNKLNEETLLQLAPEIFTCLRFEDLGRIVIENAKSILDADRCSLFVADPVERLLHNWQSDISGGGIEVFDRARETGMTIPFGQGIAGLVAETCQSVNIVDAYLDERFNSSWDRKTNYRTKSILSMPIFTTSTAKSSVTSASSFSKQPTIGGPGIFSTSQQKPSQPNQQQSLLGVVQVINKSGGAPFRANDEFLLRTISKLIGLAIENSRLFQKNQELSANIGSLIAEADLTEAILSLGTSAEDLIGVEHAAIYIYDDNEKEFYTFHRKRRHRIVLKEQMYRGSIFHQAIQERSLLLVNDIDTWPNFNAYIDSIGGVPAHNVLFAPLLKPAKRNGSAFYFGDLMPSSSNAHTTAMPTLSGNSKGLATSFPFSTSSNDKAALTSAGGLLQHQEEDQLIGILHLVNTKGRKVRFEKHDLFLSIVTSQCCSVLASILDKKQMLREKEDMTTMLETSMIFFKEMSPVGVINAVYNACACIFDVEKAHLFLWEEDRKRMWTSNLQPSALLEASMMAASSEDNSEVATLLGGDLAAGSGAAGTATATTTTGDKNSAASKTPGGLQALHRQQSMAKLHNMATTSRRLSMGTDHNLHINVQEGLLEQVLVKGSIIVVRNWDQHQDDNGSDDTFGENVNQDGNGSLPLAQSLALASAANALSNRLGMSLNCGVCIKESLQSTAADRLAGFVKHSVIACPVWDLYGADIVGVLVLLYPLPPIGGSCTYPTTGSSKTHNKLGGAGSTNTTGTTSMLLSTPKGLPTQASELANLPFFSRQITGALNVCRDLSTINLRCRQLQEMLEQATPSASYSLTFTLSHRGMLLSSSQPLNVCTRGFHQSPPLAIRHWIQHLQMDREGNRHGFQLTSASDYEMRTEHFLKWLGKDLENALTVNSLLSANRFSFEKMRVDIQTAFSRKESVFGVIEDEQSPQNLGQTRSRSPSQSAQAFGLHPRPRSQSQSRSPSYGASANGSSRANQEFNGNADQSIQQQSSSVNLFNSKRRRSSLNPTGSANPSTKTLMAPSSLSPLLQKLGRPIVWKLREFLWEFMEEIAMTNSGGSGNYEWWLNMVQTRELFDQVDRDRTGMASLEQLAMAWNSNGRRFFLEPHEWQLLGQVFRDGVFNGSDASSVCEASDASDGFTDPAKVMLDYEFLLREVQPQLHVFTSFQYEIHPVFDAITQSISSVQIILTPLLLPAVDPLPMRVVPG